MFGCQCYNSYMALLIDGYNLLHVTDIFGEPGASETVLHAAREALLRFLAAALDAKTRGETTIVFDAAGAPPGLPRTIVHQGITAHFARRHASADEMLEELIEAHPAPKSLLVVSGDHRVQRAARRRGAIYIDSDRWYAERQAERRNRGAATRPATKPGQDLTPGEIEDWVREFTDVDAKETSDSPFPPGYGEDLLE
jgi:predicted RNA-binding protein with PIN domain